MLTKVQELKLIALCVAADDRRAFGQLVEAYADDVRRLLLSLTKSDVALVDDLAQETFIKAYLAIRSLEGITRFRTWLMRIAYHEFISHTRRNRSDKTIVDIADCDVDMPDDDGDDDDRPVTDANVADALMQLPAPQRAVTQLFYFDGFSVARISTVTGLPSGTVRCYLTRARKRLANLLDKHRY
ncbi:MAG: RNA polymerase sigma factor [Paramuribaculum sp.]|nr:RNA polymerase sigma factor [Paramuribaculum sp.]